MPAPPGERNERDVFPLPRPDVPYRETDDSAAGAGVVSGRGRVRRQVADLGLASGDRVGEVREALAELFGDRIAVGPDAQGRPMAVLEAGIQAMVAGACCQHYLALVTALDILSRQPSSHTVSALSSVP